MKGILQIKFIQRVISVSLIFSETDRGVLTVTITHPSFTSRVCLNEYWSLQG